VDEDVYYVISFSLTIIGMLGVALYWLGGKFKKLEKRFEQIDDNMGSPSEKKGKPAVGCPPTRSG